MTAFPVPLTKVRIWSTSWTSSPISPPSGMVMITTWVCFPVHSTRRKSGLFSASVAIVQCFMPRFVPRSGPAQPGRFQRRRPAHEVALHVVDAQFTQQAQGGLVLHELGDRVDSVRLADLHERTHQHLVLLVLGQA